MANELKGEVDLVIDGKTYTLCFSTNAIVEVETVAGQPIGAVIAEWQASPAYAPLRTLLWGALRKYHSEVSLFDAGDMIGELGVDRMEELGGMIGKALRFRISGTAQPEPAKPKKRSR